MYIITTGRRERRVSTAREAALALYSKGRGQEPSRLSDPDYYGARWPLPTVRPSPEEWEARLRRGETCESHVPYSIGLRAGETEVIRVRTS